MKLILTSILAMAAFASSQAGTVTARQFGGTTYYSNGVTARQFGGTTYFSNGMTAREFGGTTYFNNVPGCR